MNESLIPLAIPNNRALSMFRDVVFHGRIHRLWARLTRNCFCLRDLKETLESGCVEGRRYAGLQTVSVDRIQGTESKADEFDAEFNPIQERSRSRWIGIALEQLRGRELPPVELIQVGDIYYVRDGHHRVSVSRALGQSFIEAEVTAVRLCQPCACVR